MLPGAIKRGATDAARAHGTERTSTLASQYYATQTAQGAGDSEDCHSVVRNAVWTVPQREGMILIQKAAERNGYRSQRCTTVHAAPCVPLGREALRGAQTQILNCECFEALSLRHLSVHCDCPADRRDRPRV